MESTKLQEEMMINSYFAMQSFTIDESFTIDATYLPANPFFLLPEIDL